MRKVKSNGDTAARTEKCKSGVEKEKRLTSADKHAVKGKT